MKLHIGCMGERIEGFKRLDIQQHGDVDYVQNAKDMGNFDDNSVEEIYASHILEHFTNAEVPEVLKSWHRVLVPGGILWCSVPDFDAIVEMYIKTGRVLTTWMHHLMHGDQEHPYHCHYQCFTYPILSGRLHDVGFKTIERTMLLPYGLKDASRIADNVFNTPISVNVKAVK